MAETTDSAVETFFKTFSGKDFSLKDHEDFEGRIRTYIVGQRWVRRPLALSPDICSQYGWKCISSNLLECVTCNAKLSASEPKIEMFDVYKACMEKIYKDLKMTHKTHCPWPLTPLPESFVKMIPLPKEEALKLFLNRLISSSKENSPYPQIKDTAILKLGFSDEQISSLCQLAGLQLHNDVVCKESAVTLASTGWILETKKDDDPRGYITCRSCQRSIQLESFNSATSSTLHTPSTSGDVSPLSNGSTHSSTGCSEFKNKRRKKEDFDPIYEHRPWCLFVTTAKQKSELTLRSNGVVESSDANALGWQIFLKSLLRNVSESSLVQDNPSKEQIRSVRSLLETWTNNIS